MQHVVTSVMGRVHRVMSCETILIFTFQRLSEPAGNRRKRYYRLEILRYSQDTEQVLMRVMWTFPPRIGR